MNPEDYFMLWLAFSFAVLAYFARRDMKKQEKRSKNQEAK